MGGLLEIAGEALASLLAHPVLGLLGGLAATGAGVLWIASAWWTWRDCAARTHDPIAPYVAAAAVLVATPFLFLLALVVYRVLRPPQPAAEADVAALRAAALVVPPASEPCPGCGAPADPRWRRCPACGAELTVNCERCGRQIGVGWAICPWCAAEPPSGTRWRDGGARQA